jgi:hypothetical protein
MVLGLPGGGGPVAAQVAGVPGAAGELTVVGRLGGPGRDEMAVGAVGPGGARLADGGLVAGLAFSPAAGTAGIGCAGLAIRAVYRRASGGALSGSGEGGHGHQVGTIDEPGCELLRERTAATR